MKRHLRFLSVLLTLLVLIGICCSVSASANTSDACAVNTPYEYPVTPSSDRWLEMESHYARVRACQIPEDILENMSTSALVETISNYPLLVDFLLFDRASDAYQTVFSGFNAIQELETRSDALVVLTDFLDTNSEVQTDYIRRTALEVIALAANFQSPSDSEQSMTLFNQRNSYSDAYALYPELSPNYPQLANVPRTLAPFTPTTPSGKPITVTWYYDRPEMSQEQKSQIEYNVLMTYGLYPSRDATTKYNCHSYAWHSQSTTDNLYWINYPDDYLADPLVSRIYTPRVGARIVYQQTSYGAYQHSGIISLVQGSVVQVTSKWGAWGLYHHDITNCPSDYGTVVSYYVING